MQEMHEAELGNVVEQLSQIRGAFSTLDSNLVNKIFFLRGYLDKMHEGQLDIFAGPGFAISKGQYFPETGLQGVMLYVGKRDTLVYFEFRHADSKGSTQEIRNVIVWDGFMAGPKDRVASLPDDPKDAGKIYRMH